MKEIQVPSGWKHQTLGCVASIKIGKTPPRDQSQYWDTHKQTNNIWLSIKDLTRRYISDSAEYITDRAIRERNIPLVDKNTVLLSFKLTIGKVGIAQRDLRTNEAIAALKILTPDEIDNDFLYYGLGQWDLLQDVDQAIKGTTLNKKKLQEIGFVLPISVVEQRQIANILSTLDDAIAQSEALVRKYQSIKQGLMSDLLTRGVDENGELRNEKTHIFKISALGGIPTEWRVETLRQISLSATDGPFGSNLKTEHYRQDGVRVVRLQNIGECIFDDSDKAYISAAHASNLSRFEVRAGDLLIAAMGDENHLIARACLYPGYISTGIVKADCFRFRLDPKQAINSYAMWVLSCAATRRDLYKLGQGVTRDRINLKNVQTFRLRIPSVDEQERIVEILNRLQASIENEELHLSKLNNLKQGLMQDLLSGQVRVTGLSGS